MGLGGVEPPTSRLSGVRSNHLSYRPLPVESRRQTRPDQLMSSAPLRVNASRRVLFDGLDRLQLEILAGSLDRGVERVDNRILADLLEDP